jgi:toxin-antitoxin system PIN domain toxin
MIYLLDVNVLLAMHYATHVHHDRAERWLDDLGRRGALGRFATCSITELGFVRIAGNKNVDLAQNVTAARRDLKRLKEEWSFSFVTDPLGAAHLPSWVERPRHVTDGHLLALATARGARLVTLDSGIPGALLIPDLSNGPTMIREPWTPYRVETRYASRLN